jgi:serine protease Do
MPVPDHPEAAMTLAPVSYRMPILPLRVSLAAALLAFAALPAAAAPAAARHGAELGSYNGDEEDARPATAVARARLGLGVQSVDAALADALGLKSEKGVLVTAVVPGGPGEEAGLKRGDVILRVDDAVVRDAAAFAAAFARVKPGRETDLTLMRGIKTLELSIMPGRMTAPPRAGRDDDEPGLPTGARLGLRVAEPDRGLRRRYGLGGAGDGVVILSVQAGRRAEAAGLKEGDFIVEADRRGLRSTGDLLAAVAHGRKRGRLVLLVQRGEDVFYVPVRFD